jgi:hypothetical protein
MSETEDYPGPTQHQPEKQGQDPRGRADEDMVKPFEKPKPDSKKDKVVESPERGLTNHEANDSDHSCSETP